MARFCASCGNKIEDGLMFCTACGARVETAVSQEVPVAQEAVYQPEVSTEAVAEYTYTSEQVPAPDFTGTLVKKDSKKQMWLVAIVAQLLCILLFLMPTIRFKVTVPGDVASEMGSSSISNMLGSGFGQKNARDFDDYDYGDYDFGENEGQAIGASKASDMDVLKGNFKYMNVVDMFSTEVYHTVLLLAVIIALALMIYPVIKKKELDPVYALYMLAAQAVFFIYNIIMLLVINGKPVSMIKKAAKMICVEGIDSYRSTINAAIDKLCDTIKDFYKFGFSVWGWIYIAVSVIAIGVLGKIVYDNKAVLFSKFKKKAAPLEAEQTEA
ncbi:MAG: zinc ribbon domain-containing protein [Ruminococcus sp.]|nr:zinc ribbon domain-containing protein [Ruminococcus sp.]